MEMLVEGVKDISLHILDLLGQKDFINKPYLITQVDMGKVIALMSMLPEQ